MNEGKYYAAGEVVYKAECMTIYCSMSCKIEMDMNEMCGRQPPSEPLRACYPSECGKAPAWRIKKIVCKTIWNPAIFMFCILGWWITCAHARAPLGGDDKEERGHTRVHVWRNCHLLSISTNGGSLLFPPVLLSSSIRYNFRY